MSFYGFSGGNKKGNGGRDRRESSASHSSGRNRRTDQTDDGDNEASNRAALPANAPRRANDTTSSYTNQPPVNYDDSGDYEDSNSGQYTLGGNPREQPLSTNSQPVSYATPSYMSNYRSPNAPGDTPYTGNNAFSTSLPPSSSSNFQYTANARPQVPHHSSFAGQSSSSFNYSAQADTRDVTRLRNQFAHASLETPPRGRELSSGEKRYGDKYVDSADWDDIELSKDFKLCKGKSFKFGKVFKILWSQPRGEPGAGTVASDGTTEKVGTKSDKSAYTGIRRFAIVEQHDAHCVGIPITTHSGRGTINNRRSRNDEAVIWVKSSKTPRPPSLLKGEQKLEKEPIAVKADNPRIKLKEASRINFAKPSSIDYNNKVEFLGKIHPDSMDRFKEYYDAHHRPLAPGMGRIREEQWQNDHFEEEEEGEDEEEETINPEQENQDYSGGNYGDPGPSGPYGAEPENDDSEYYD